jgi:hypothetical protein
MSLSIARERRRGSEQPAAYLGIRGLENFNGPILRLEYLGNGQRFGPSTLLRH